MGTYLFDSFSGRTENRPLSFLGIEKLEAELVLIDPKNRPNEANEKKIKGFYARLK